MSEFVRREDGHFGSTVAGQILPRRGTKLRRVAAAAVCAVLALQAVPVRAQQATCNYESIGNSETYVCAASGTSPSNGFYGSQTGTPDALPMTVTSDGAASVNVTSGAGVGLHFISDGESGQSGTVDGLQLTNNGTISLTAGVSQLGIPIWGIQAIEADGSGNSGGDSQAVLSVTNNDTINMALQSLQIVSGNYGGGILAADEGGSGIGDGASGGSSFGATVQNGGAITAAAMGAVGFAGIQALSAGGHGSTDGGTGGTGGAGGSASVTSSAPVSVNWTWADAGSINDGLYGITAQSSGGVGGNGSSGDDAADGGTAGPASVTLNLGGNVTVTENGAPPSGAPPSPDAGVSAAVIGGVGGYAGYGDYIDGGSGGAAMGSAQVSVTDADVTTAGTQLPGILVVGEGGLGGNGNLDGWQAGGGGGDAAGAASVSVTAITQSVAISTAGTKSPAVAAILQGGAGGQGGMQSRTSANSGAGGAGGNVSGTANVDLTGQSQINSLATTGSTSPGVYAASIGGNGGAGGASQSPGGSNAGDGGAGGTGDNVSVDLTATNITTQADTSPGIVALSQGGVGGLGGFGGGGLGSANGGDGGRGGGTGTVAVSLGAASSITTQGSGSVGILAQSISGAGGNSSGNNGVTGSPGNGGTGGSAQNVTVTNAGTITTSGDTAYGILAQSLVGSGGAGGGTWGLSATGGTGGASGTVGAATVINSGSISTTGTDAAGVLAESIGGSGGAGGSASGFSTTGGLGGNSTSNPFFSNGSEVAFTEDGGSVLTTGLSSIGIEEQSIGGGGGDGGAASGLSLAVGGTGSGGGGASDVSTLLNGGSITTENNQSPALLAQSIGGGGGNGGNATANGFYDTVSIGGGGGGGGYGSTVNVDSNGADITTTGSLSPGMEAQSIGGGGGNGGNSFAASVGVGATSATTIGGTGGNGGNANTAAVTVTGGEIATGQDPLLAYGALEPNTSTTSGCTALPCNTLPTDDYGVLVQSIGGGGGMGGTAIAQAITIALPVTPGIQVGFAAGLALGGNGGGGGTGGTAQFSLSDGGSILTAGQESDGVLIQSIGGGGGAGGNASASASVVGFGSLPGGLPESGPQLAASFAFTLGGNGGDGNSAGNVEVALSGEVSPGAVFTADAPGQTTSIATYGDYADAVLAQSIGGGGGNAGFGSGDTENQGSGTSLQVAVDLGSTGGYGGNGGAVQVNDYAGDTITTWGSGAIGIVAQSIGGGGGTSQGGSVFAQADVSYDPNSPVNELNLPSNFPQVNFRPGVRLSLGVDGAGGGVGSNVNVNLGGTIITHGGGSDGVLAQSIGGGGGLAGNPGSDGSADNPVVEAANSAEAISNLRDIYSSSKVPFTATAAVAIGATGGTGDNAGNVNVQDAGSIATSGDWANGILAQSIGGGGGDGGTAAATGTGDVPEVTVNADYGLGGSGGAGGDGESTTVALSQFTENGTLLSPSISTTGYAAPGVEAQSIGGGGGKGGDGSDSQTGNLTIGGATGGSGGATGDGGAVDLIVNLPDNPNSATISTTGAASDGVDLESIGGGGGSAGMGSSLFVATPNESGTINLAVGGGSGADGDGGAVTFGPQNPSAAQYFTIATTGYDAFGILAQSIGGGGGIATADPSAGTMNAAFSDAGSGTGGTVSVTLPSGSSVSTSGIGAIGILAQSIGGGGGIARYGDSSDNAVALSTTRLPPGDVTVDYPPKNSSGGDVTVNLNGNVTVEGQGAIGLFAQSIGGGGGLLAAGNTWYAGSPAMISPENYCGTGSSCSVGGAIDMTLYGSVTASGAGSTGIFAQSTGDGPSSGRVDIQVWDYQTVEGGSTGIWVDTLSTSPTAYVTMVDADVTNELGVNGNSVIVTGGGQLALANDCFTYKGQNYCGTITGDASLNGGQFTNDGTYNPGPETSADLTNSGIVSLVMLGKTGKFASTLVGNYTQTGTGQLQVLVDSLHKSATQFVVDGAASVAGSIVPSALTLLPGTLPVLSATTLTSTARTEDPLVFHWNLAEAGKALTISPTSNFTPAGITLTKSETSLAGYLTRAFNNSDDLFATEFATLSQIGDPATYRATLDAYSGKAAEAQSLAYINSAAAILGSAMSCPNYIDQGVRLGENSCVWMKVTAQQSNQWEGNDTQGYRVSSVTTRLGGQQEFLPDWFIGGTAAIGTTSSSEDGTENGDSGGHGATYDGSIAVKHLIGPWVFDGSVALADGEYHSTRFINLPGTSETLHGDPSLFMAGTQFRAGYEFAFNNFYVQPYGDLAVLYTNLRSFSESGPTPAALYYRGDGKVTVALSPMVELGGRIDLNDTTILRPFGELGASFIPDNSRSMEASFVGANSENGLFRSYLDSPGATADLGIGIEIYRAGGLELKAEYDATVGGSYISQNASAKLAYDF